MTWSVESWKSKPNAQDFAYDDPVFVDSAVAKRRSLPPLVTSWEK